MLMRERKEKEKKRGWSLRVGKNFHHSPRPLYQLELYSIATFCFDFPPFLFFFLNLTRENESTEKKTATK